MKDQLISPNVSCENSEATKPADVDLLPLPVTGADRPSACAALPEPHPLGDQAGRVAHAMEMKTTVNSGPEL